MGRDLTPQHKHCRALGEKICLSKKCPVTRRPFGPGVHGPTRRNQKLSGYAIQLREKQKAKWHYNILERQFRKYFEAAAQKVGDTGVNLVQTLEMRLDNVVYRLGFAQTRRMARQMVGHGFFTLNGKLCDISSAMTVPGDVIGIKENRSSKKIFNGLEERLKVVKTPGWLSLNVEKREGKVLNAPIGEDLKQIFDPKLIVELYSR
ncbi:MAG: 30S ribosomal protein S4 [bacterium]